MEKKLQELLQIALSQPENEDAKDAYIEAMTSALAKDSDVAGTVTSAIKGVSIDHATCIRDLIESDKGDAKRRAELFKAIKNDDLLKGEKKSPEAFRFLCVLLASAIGSKAVLDNLLPFIVSSLVPKDWDGEIHTSEKKCRDFEEFFLLELPAKAVMPDWKAMKVKASIANKLMVWLEAYLPKDVSNEDLLAAAKGITRWINIGKPYISGKLEKEEWEATRPARKTEELIALAEHYKKTDEALDKLHEENKGLKKDVQALHRQIEEQQGIIREMNASAAAQQKALEAAKQTETEYQHKLQESQNLNVSLETFRKDAEASLLQDIANALRAEYQDFMASIDDEMDIELGEIYREKLKSIFRILEGKGIKV